VVSIKLVFELAAHNAVKEVFLKFALMVVVFILARHYGGKFRVKVVYKNHTVIIQLPVVNG